MVDHLARQLLLPPGSPLDAPAKRDTTAQHRHAIRIHLGFVPCGTRERDALSTWAERQASGAESTSELVRRACAWLFQQHIARPGRTVLERLVGSAAERAEATLLDALVGQLSEPARNALDRLIATDDEGPTSFFAQLRVAPGKASAANIRAHLDRIERLEALPIEDVVVPPEAEGWLARLANQLRRYNARDIRRMAPNRRYAMMACFIRQARARLLDEAVQLHDNYVTDMCRRARRKHETLAARERRRAREALAVVLGSVRHALQADDLGGGFAEAVEERGGREEVAQLLELCEAAGRADREGYRRQLSARYSPLRKFLKTFLHLPLRCGPGAESLLQAIELVRQLDREGRRPLPPDAPMTFIPQGWRDAIVNDDGQIDRALWETQLAITIRDELRSGDLFVEGSQHHASFTDLVYDEERWNEERDEAFAQLQLPIEPPQGVAAVMADFQSAADQFLQALPTNPFARIEEGRLKTCNEPAQAIPDEAMALRSAVGAGLSPVRLERLLMEVDAACGFTEPLRQAAEPSAASRNAVLAGLIAQGTNLGLVAMRSSTEGVARGEIERAVRQCLHPGPLKEANRRLVNAHHGLALAQHFGQGVRSSSDGQRFGVQAGSLIASSYPRYFGYYDRAVSVYTHVSDQHSVFASRVISCAPREALYVLDGLLDNDTLIDPKSHHVDTHGATEPLFGMCYLLGFELQPRMAGLPDLGLYKDRPDARYGPLDSLLQGAVSPELLEEQWDDLARVAASMIRHTAPAHVVIHRLTASKRSRLSRALVDLGRLIKTTYLLRYLSDAELRSQVRRQLNRGEARHALAKRLFFGNHGMFRTGDIEQLTSKASALSVLCNAVVYWNTVRMQQILTQLRAEQVVDDAWLRFLTPLAHAHVVVNGVYRFDVEEEG